MLAVGSNPRKVINEYSDQFLKDFLQLLRTGHGEKQVQINHFYQEYIARRDHIHMNSTRWSSLTELAKHLGQESICRVEENEKGIFISWIDTSPEALRRQEALRRKEAQDRGDEEWERRMLKAQIQRAERAAQARHGDDQAGGEDDDDDEETEKKKNLLQRPDGEKVKLSFGSARPESTTATAVIAPPASDEPPTSGAKAAAEPASTKAAEDGAEDGKKTERAVLAPPAAAPPATKPMSLKLGGLGKPQPKNVFAAAKKNALFGGGGGKKIEVPKKMSEAERIMKEELERKRSRDFSSHGGGRSNGPNKKPRF